MSRYRGYFMQSEHIAAPANIDATDDAQAMLKAAELLSTSQFVRIEVWQETRVVGALSAPVPSPAYVGTLDKDVSHLSDDGAARPSPGLGLFLWSEQRAALESCSPIALFLLSSERRRTSLERDLIARCEVAAVLFSRDL